MQEQNNRRRFARGRNEQILAAEAIYQQFDAFHHGVLQGAELAEAEWTGEAGESLPAISHAAAEKSGIIVRDLRDSDSVSEPVGPLRVSKSRSQTGCWLDSLECGFFPPVTPGTVTTRLSQVIPRAYGTVN